jgi:hypothetical protein
MIKIRKIVNSTVSYADKVEKIPIIMIYTDLNMDINPVFVDVIVLFPVKARVCFQIHCFQIHCSNSQ